MICYHINREPAFNDKEYSMTYDDLLRDAMTSSRHQYRNGNAKVLAAAGLINVANILEEVSKGCDISSESLWQRRHNEYTVYDGIPPVVGFNNTRDAIEFYFRLCQCYPKARMLRIIRLKYIALALNDRRSNIEYVDMRKVDSSKNVIEVEVARWS